MVRRVGGSLVLVVLVLAVASGARAQGFCCVCFSDTGCVNRQCDAGCAVVADQAACDALCGGQECRAGGCHRFDAPCVHGAFCGSGAGRVCDVPEGLGQIPFCCDPSAPGSGCFQLVSTPTPGSTSGPTPRVTPTPPVVVVPTRTPTPTRTPVGGPVHPTPGLGGMALGIAAALLTVLGVEALRRRVRN
jgi:hypothetical protein